ncbi:phosphate signaling complex protein PhoU [Streptococcus cameli]
MIRTTFQQQLQSLNNNLIIMGALCEDIIASSLRSLDAGTVDFVENVSETHQKIEQMERDIEEQCLKLLLRQQPVAKDLRRISSALKMVYDMKRIGAQSAEVADIIANQNLQDSFALEFLREMAGVVIKMVTESIDAFVQENEVLAYEVVKKDDIVDQHFDTIKEELIRYFSHQMEDVEHIIDLLMVAKYLERIGDHTVNIAKWVIYSMTGQLDGEQA